LIVVEMHVMLPFGRQYQLLTNNIAAAKSLQKSEKRFAPVFENEKIGVLILITPTHSTFGGRFV